MFVVAIDGPAASGKGTIAKLLARQFRLAHLDTGLLYRGVALAVLRSGGDPNREADAMAVVDRLWSMDLDDPALRAAQTGAAASKVAAMTPVRDALFAYQRAFAERPPGSVEGNVVGSVIEGRDITTVICPAAEVKIFITASLPVRAARRFRDLVLQDPRTTLETVEAELAARDARDTSRADAPLRRADDAALLDTTDLTIEAAFSKVAELVASALARPR